MPAHDSPAVIVARFLRVNHYSDTLEAFLSEAGLPADAGSIGEGDLTIEKILEEKQVFDLTLRFEKVGDRGRRWTVPAPSEPYPVSTLPSAANLLHVSIQAVEDEASQTAVQLLFASTSDRRLHLVHPQGNFPLKNSLAYHDSPILDCVSFDLKGLITITTGMSGQVVVYDHKHDLILDERRDHKKYVVKIAFSDDRRWVATAGWDAQIFLYCQSEGKLGQPVAFITLPTIPETIMFVKHPDSGRLTLLVTRRDSTSLHFFQFPTPGEISTSSSSTASETKLLGSQNLAPHSNAWIAFSLSSIAVCPTDPTLLAVASSAVPYMKLIIVRLLFPPVTGSSLVSARPTTQAAQTRANLALQDREDAAIKVHVTTSAPQTPYSTPQVVWRPDGSGVWVNGDDGVLRGLEAKTGEVVATLKNGHEMGSKIRTIWCGLVDVDGEKEEWLVSGGFDRRLVVWKPQKKAPDIESGI